MMVAGYGNVATRTIALNAVHSVHFSTHERTRPMTNRNLSKSAWSGATRYMFPWKADDPGYPK